jgi:plasmid stabilization system protein ParE
LAILGPSFRSFWGRRLLVPGTGYGKRACVLAAVALLAGGCGSAGGEKAVARKAVHGAGYTFEAPADWAVQRSLRTVQATPSEGPEIVSVSVFPLRRRYEPELWPRVVPELDRVAARLADALGANVGTRRTETIDGRRARSYEVAYRRNGAGLVERIVFVLEGKREFQLLCRWQKDDPRAGKDACAGLTASFTLG